MIGARTGQGGVRRSNGIVIAGIGLQIRQRDIVIDGQCGVTVGQGQISAELRHK